MATNSFTEGAEKLNHDVDNARKWFEDTTSAIMETQTKQMEFANDMYSQWVNSFLRENKTESFDNSFDLPKRMMDGMQKTTESFIEAAKSAMKTFMDYSKNADSMMYSKDILNTMSENFNKQMDMITTVNKSSFDILSKQFNFSKTAFSPAFEKSKKEIEANFLKSKETMQEIVNSYAKLKSPTAESNKKMLDDLNKNLNTLAQDNFKLWSELLNNYNPTESKK